MARHFPDDNVTGMERLGFFETLRVDRRVVRRFERHWNRLNLSLRRWNIRFPESKDDLVQLVSNEICRFPSDAHLRLRITVRPEREGKIDSDGFSLGKLVVQAEDLPVDYLNFPVRPYRATILRDLSIVSTHPLIGHKSAKRELYSEAKRRAQAGGFDEALLLNERGELVEASSANLFWIAENRLFTPSLSCGCLPGVFSGVIRDWARERKIEIHDVTALPDALLEAQSAFLTNSLAGVIPLEQVDDYRFGQLQNIPLGQQILRLGPDLGGGDLDLGESAIQSE